MAIKTRSGIRIKVESFRTAPMTFPDAIEGSVIGDIL